MSQARKCTTDRGQRVSWDMVQLEEMHQNNHDCESLGKSICTKQYEH